MEFCHRFFSRYIHHSPSNAPQSDVKNTRRAITFKEFCQRYETRFGSDLPDLWRDATSVASQRRVFNDRAGPLMLRDEGDTVALVNAADVILLKVNDLARDALAFLVATPVFYVRELPGDLTGDEKVDLIAALVEHKIVRIGG